MDENSSGKFPRRIEFAAHWLGMAVGAAFVIAFAPTLAYLSSLTRVFAIGGFGAGLWLSGWKLVVARSACFWGALAGFAVGFVLDMGAGRYPGYPDRLPSMTFAAVIFSLSATRVAVEAVLLWSIVSATANLLERWRESGSTRLESSFRSSLVLLGSALLLALIEFRGTG